MSRYRIFVTRTTTTVEHAVVMLNSSSEAYARQDLLVQVPRWEESSRLVSEPEIIHISKLDAKEG